MNRITICKTIIQFIKNYITDPSKLEPHRAKNRFIRSRKLSMLHVIMYLFYSSKASMYQNLSSIREDLPQLDFPSVSKQALSKARQFISPDLFKELFYLSVDLFTSISLPENFGMASIFSPLMAPNLNFLIPPLTSTFLENFLGIQILTASSPWLFPLLFMMSSMIISSTLLYIIILLPNVLPLSNISKSLKISGSSITVSLFLTGAIILRISSATVFLRGISVLCA